MTPAEARALVKQRLVDRKYLPALTGIQLKRLLKDVSDNDWDLLADDIKSNDSTNGWPLVTRFVTDPLGVLSEEEVDGWIADKSIPPGRLVDLL